jgi:hypothetical protein
MSKAQLDYALKLIRDLKALIDAAIQPETEQVSHE